MTLGRKSSYVEDAFSHALQRAHAEHWQAVNRLQLENEQLRKSLTMSGIPHRTTIACGDLKVQSGVRGASEELRQYLQPPRLHPLQALASGGGSDPSEDMDECAPTQSGSSPKLRNMGSACQYELREQWKAGSDEIPLALHRASADRYEGVGSSSWAIIKEVASPIRRRNRLGALRSSLDRKKLRCNGCMHPESNRRIFWDICSIAFLVYDCVMIPLSFFKFDFGSWGKFAGYVSTSFWTLDIFASFGTGVYRNGVLQSSPAIVAVHYLKTWLCFDAAVTGLEWILMFLDADDSDGASSISGIRFMRLMRFVRIVRAVKLSVITSKLTRRVNNVTLRLVLGLLGHLSVLLMLNHLTAAIWYTMGEIGSSSDGWMASLDFESRSPTYIYLSSLHWSITNFHGSMEVNPRNERERAFACSVLILGIVGFSSFVASITNYISMVQDYHEVRTRKYHLLCKYLLKHNISGALSAKAKRCFEEQMMLEQQEEEIDLAQILSGDILDELHEEVRSYHIMSSSLFCFFCSNYPRVARHLCKDAMAEQHATHTHNFFFHGDACECVTIIKTGTARYIHHKEANEKDLIISHSAHASVHEFTHACGEIIRDNRWICEMVLWTQWVCCGWFGTLSNCQALTIDQKAFGNVVKHYEHARYLASNYAKHALDYLEIIQPSDVFSVDIDLDVPDWPRANFGSWVTTARRATA